MQVKVHQTSFIDDKLANAGEVIELAARRLRIKGKVVEQHHTLGPHMEPIDDEAKELAKSQGHTFTGEIPDIVEQLARDLEDAKKKAEDAERKALAEAISAGIVSGLQPALLALAEAVKALAEAPAKGK